MDRITEIALSLGSNLGDRRAHLDFAVARLRTLLGNPRVSHYIETDAQGVAEPQPRYLNAAMVGETRLSARDLLTELQAIERDRGRERPWPAAPRTLDVDLILFGEAVIREPGLAVPHPRFRERRFVLEPLAEIRPDLVDPETGKTIGRLLDDNRAAQGGAV